ncbi:hypothetical protein MUO83_03480 [Candidatus Bathyarchaeota archaeon]|nr:hypothetical protein [Candidatus Bathyarchaeota archaeon]
MHITRETKAISTILLIILLLCAIIGGALISYLWVMASFYAEPGITELAITNAEFPADHADYFNVTILNPSHSPSAANITQIYFTAEGDSKTHNVTDVSPERYPITLERGTQTTVKCKESWSAYAGKTIAVHVSATDASGAVRSFPTPFVGLSVQSYFNATESIKYFNVSITNDPSSAINLTLTNVYFEYNAVTNTTIQLPKAIQTNETINLQCFADWQGHPKPYVKVETAEGYAADVQKDVLSSVDLLVTNIDFGETNSSETNITLFNRPESATLVDITDIELTFDNGTNYNVTQNIVNEAIPYKLDKNTTVTFMCNWSWATYRDRNLTVTAYTEQGFISSAGTAITPKPIIFNITDTRFDLTATGFFLLNVTNSPISQSSLNIAEVKFNNDTIWEVSPSHQIIPSNTTAQLNCTFDWTNFRGTSANITAITQDGLNVSVTVTLPSINLTIMDLAAFDNSAMIAYVNITISNSVFSSQNATIKHIAFTVENVTYIIDGRLTIPSFVPSGYVLTIGASVTVVCPWNWTLYHGQSLTVTVQTQEGAIASQTFTFNIP